MNGFKLKYKSRIGYNFVEGVTKFSQNKIADQFNIVPLSFTKHAPPLCLLKILTADQFKLPLGITKNAKIVSQSIFLINSNNPCVLKCFLLLYLCFKINIFY